MPLPERRLYAHRGASRARPENTLEAFRQALEEGATALELDVHLSRDGHLVVSHDPDGGRRCGVSKSIRDCGLAEIRTWDAGQGTRLPTFDEVLALAPVPLNVDLKPLDRAVVRAALESISRHDATARTTLASFHEPVMAEVRRLEYAGPRSLTPNEVKWLALTPGFLHRSRVTGHAVQVPPRAGPLRFDSEAFIDRCHDLGLRVDYWVVNDAAAARRLYDLGADGVMTDDPALLAPVFRALPPRPA